MALPGRRVGLVCFLRIILYGSGSPGGWRSRPKTHYRALPGWQSRPSGTAILLSYCGFGEDSTARTRRMANFARTTAIRRNKPPYLLVSLPLHRLSTGGIAKAPHALRSSRHQREGKVRTLHMADVAFRLLMAALDSAHPGDQPLKGVEPVRGLAGVSVAGGPFSRLCA